MSDNTDLREVFSDFSLKTSASEREKNFFCLHILQALMSIEKFLDVPTDRAPAEQAAGKMSLYKCLSTCHFPPQEGDESAVIGWIFPTGPYEEICSK